MAANQNVTQLTQQTGSAVSTSLFYAVTGGTNDTGLPLSVLVNSLGLTGIPTAPTATPNTNTTQLATTAYVVGQGYLTVATAAATYAPIASPTFTGTVTIPAGASISGFAPLASPALTGVPVAPTATFNTNTTQLATTAYVVGQGYLTSTTATSTYATIAQATTALAATGGTVNGVSVGATTASTGKFTTLQATSTITPSTTSGIVGTTLADNANAGSVGEYITSAVTAVSLTTNTPANVTSISLTAGDWDVRGNVVYKPAASSLLTTVVTSINNVSATSAASPFFATESLSNPAGAIMSSMPPIQRINISTTTTIFLVASTAFTVSTLTCDGFISARRVR